MGSVGLVMLVIGLFVRRGQQIIVVHTFACHLQVLGCLAILMWRRQKRRSVLSMMAGRLATLPMIRVRLLYCNYYVGELLHGLWDIFFKDYLGQNCNFQ